MKKKPIKMIWRLGKVEVTDLGDLYKQDMTPQLQADLEAISDRMAEIRVGLAQDYLNRQPGLTYEQKITLMYQWRDGYMNN